MRRDNSTAANTRIVGQVIGGEFGRVAIRQKAGIEMEIGDILVLEEKDYNILLMVFDLQYASQMDDKMHEMISGVSLEEDSSGNVQFYEPNLVNYVIAHVKPLVRVKKGGSPADGEPVSTMTKTLPPFTSKLRSIEEEDLKFLDGGKDGLAVRDGFRGNADGRATRFATGKRGPGRRSSPSATGRPASGPRFATSFRKRGNGRSG